MQVHRCLASPVLRLAFLSLGRNYSALGPQGLERALPYPSSELLDFQVAESCIVRPHKAHQSRFDWRKRAVSRLPPEKMSPYRHKRIRPPPKELTLSDPFYQAIQSYSGRFLPLLSAEQAKQEEGVRHRLSTWPVARLQKEGYCLTQMSAFWLRANQHGRPIAVFSLGPGVTLPEHQFETGTQVLVSRVDPLKELPLRGSVVSKTASQLKISFREQCKMDGAWRLDSSHGVINFERMRSAISCLKYDPQQIENIGPEGVEYPLLGTQLRDILLRTFQPAVHHPHTELQLPDDPSYPSHNGLDHVASTSPNSFGAFSDDMRISSWACRYLQPNPLIMPGDPIIKDMDSSQIRAMALMISQRLSLVQGPPGTGKTKTIVETVKLLKCHFEVPHPILLCTYTNAAVDNLVEGLATAGLKPLRVAAGGRIRPRLSEYTLESKRDAHPKKSELDNLEKQKEQLEDKVETLRKHITRVEKQLIGHDAQTQRLEILNRRVLCLERRLQALTARVFAVEQIILRDIIARADVLCTTCFSSAGLALNVTDFPVVFLDEASMSTEPASLIPLMKGSRHVALIGDHKQLPPVIISAEGKNMGLGISLFERLTEEGETPSIMLDTQYRMHPAISRFPASEFYNHALRDGTVDSIGNIEDRLKPPVSRHLADLSSLTKPSVVFIDHAGSESMKDRSRRNLTEAHIVVSIVEDLLLNNTELRGIDIGIISPYAAQISLLNGLLNAESKERFREVLGDSRAMQLEDIEIKTVDGFEGRQKDVIIFSTVRNNAGGHIGFLADRRRLNVGLTRAKRGLFVVGSLNTLKNGKMGGYQGDCAVARIQKGAESWQRYIKYLSENGLVLHLSGAKLSQTLDGNRKTAKGPKSRY